VVAIAVKSADGSGVPEARVIAYHGNSDVATALTDAAGELRLDVPAEARITKLVAFKSGAGFDYRTVPSDGFQKPIGSLEPFSEPVSLVLGGALDPRTIVVTDPSNMPVPGLRVTLSEVLKPEHGQRILMGDSRWLSAVTDAKGEVRFDALPSDTRCNIRFGFVSDRWLGTYGTSTYPADPVNIIEALVEPMRTLSGKVVDGQGKPIPGASIQTRSRLRKPERFALGRTRTDRDGRFQLEVPRGEGQVALLIRSGSSSVNVAANFDGDENLEIGDQLVVEPLATLRGEVRTPEGKLFERPIAANLFSRSGWSYYPRSDDKGQYSIRLPAGDYSLSIGAQRESLLLTAGEDRVLNLQIQPQETVPPAKAPLQGVVRKPDGSPVAKARLLHHGNPPRRIMRVDLAANDAGQFRYDRESGPAIVYASSPKGDLAGYKELDATQLQVDIQLSPTATAVGRVLDSDGQPISGVQVSLMLTFPVESWKGAFTNTFELGGTTDKEGRFRVARVPVGAGIQVNVHMRIGPGRGGDAREGVPIDRAGDVAIPDTIVKTEAAP
jgi:hypothetical protein